MKDRLGKILNAEAVELPETWYTYAVPDVPYSFPDYTQRGIYVNTADVIADEVFIKARSRPVSCRPSRYGPDPVTGRGTWLVSFLNPVSSFRLFDSSGISRYVEKKPTIELHNPGCQGYCDRKRCNRVPRCNNCGGELRLHSGGLCDKQPMCANCKGPFPAGHEGCAAAPKRANGRLIRPSGTERKKIRKAGARRYRAAVSRQEAAAQEDAMQEAILRDVEEAEKEVPDQASPPEDSSQEKVGEVIVVRTEPAASASEGSLEKNNGRKRTRDGTMTGTGPTHVLSHSQSAETAPINMLMREETHGRRARPAAEAARAN